MKPADSREYYHENDRLTDGFDIFFWVFDDKSSYVSPHWHSAIEITYVIDGEVDVIMSNKAIYLRPGDVNLIDSGAIHSTRSLRGNKALLVQLPYPLLTRYIADFDNLRFSFDCHAQDEESVRKRKELVEILLKMEAAFEERPAYGALLFNSYVFELLYLLCNHFSRLKDDIRRTTDGIRLERIKTVLRYTQDHYNEQITLSKIASVAAVQREYFCNFFKKHMGQTYFQYLNELRMSYIHKDLISTDLPIKTILDKHGFTNYKVFRRMFAEQYHTTPSEYRRDYTEIE